MREIARRLQFVKNMALRREIARRVLPSRPRPTILMYHRIAEETFDPWGLAVTPDNFADQLSWLAENRTVVTLENFAKAHADASLPANAIALTFDDGYACTADTAAPLLEKFGIPATIFLPVELIERGEPFWWDELEVLVLNSDRESLRIGEDEVALGEKNAADGTWKPGAPPQTPRQVAFHRVWAVLRTLPPVELNRAMAKLRTRASTTAPPRGHPMSPAQVRNTTSKAISFGSHALTHPWLTSLQTPEKSHEIGDSMERCAALIGTRPVAFAYPYGNFDDESERLVREAGFICACATIPSYVTNKSRPFALPRIQVGNWTAATFARALGTRRIKGGHSRGAVRR